MLSRLNHAGEVVLVNDSFPNEKLFSISVKTPWFIDMANYLATGNFPAYFSSNLKKRIIRKSVDYSWIRGDIFFTGLDLIIYDYVREDEIYAILRVCQDEPCVRNFTHKRTAYKILRSCYYWKSIFNDAREYVQKCESYQRMGWLL